MRSAAIAHGEFLRKEIAIGNADVTWYARIMSAAEVINLIKKLPEAEKREVAIYLQSSEAKIAKPSPAGKRMTFDEAKEHVFANYGDLLKKLAE